MKNEKILIVEDEAVISLAIEEILSNLGYSNIESAYNATTASDLLKNNHYDLVLMDVKLGSDKDGIDVINEVKIKYDVPVIYVTGNSDQQTIQKAKVSKPYGFLTKPISEADLRIQLEIALYKEKFRRLELEEEEDLGSVYEGDCSGLNLELGFDGHIYSASKHIRKLTGKPSYFYKGKKVKNADFDPAFYRLLTYLLKKVKSTSQRSFFGNVFSKYLGERVVEILAEETGISTCQLLFRDVTETLYRENSTGPCVEIAVASDNRAITSGFRTIPSFVENTRIAAELQDSLSVIEYLRVNRMGILMLDIDLPGGCKSILEYLSDTPENKTNVLIMLNKESKHIEKLKKLKTYSFIGYLSKTANDTVIMEAIKCAAGRLNYHEPAIDRLMA